MPLTAAPFSVQRPRRKRQRRWSYFLGVVGGALAYCSVHESSSLFPLYNDLKSSAAVLRRKKKQKRENSHENNVLATYGGHKGRSQMHGNKRTVDRGYNDSRQFRTMPRGALPQLTNAQERGSVFLPIDIDNNNQQYSNQNTSWPFASAKDVRIVLTHVGKAGGKSLYQTLGIIGKTRQMPCFMRGMDPSKCIGSDPGTSILRQRIIGHVHVGSARYRPQEKEWFKQNSNLLLFTVRDPVDRIVSSFNYHHNEVFGGNLPLPREQYEANDLKSQIYLECFPEVEDLALAVDPHNTTAFAMCRRMGSQLLAGNFTSQPCLHFKWNYVKYASLVWEDRSKPVAVLRTTSLWQDVARLEKQLGGNPRLFTDKSDKFTHGSESYVLQSGVSPRGAFSLCCGLFLDLQVYQELVLAAVNLDQAEKEATLAKVFHHCGVHHVVEPALETLQSWNWADWHNKSCARPESTVQ